MLQDWNSLQKRQYTAARAVLAGSPQLLKITGRYNPSSVLPRTRARIRRPINTRRGLGR